jgi:hypothetical protein
MSGMAIWWSSYGSTCVTALARVHLMAAFTRHFASPIRETQLSKMDNISLWFFHTTDHAIVHSMGKWANVVRCAREQCLPANSLWETLAIN